MFIDEAEIYIKAGNGGNGAVSFRREKYIPNGGPDGGDGGRGGNVTFVADDQQHGLSQFVSNKRFLAQNGQNGMGTNKSGKNGEELRIKVPTGTLVYNRGQLIVEFLKNGEERMMCKGGNGGWGNQHFASSIKQKPEWAKDGLRGDSYRLNLELKVIADIGLVGLPNAGKSTLLSVVSNARPKIADYPFTTLEPNLGILKANDRNIVIADIPGLIEGAAEGKGLGDKFLRHIERTKTIVHLIDPMGDYITNYKIIKTELKKFSKSLLQKPEIVVVNKSDLLSEEDKKTILKNFKKIKISPIFISAAAHSGLDVLVNLIKSMVE